MVRKQSHTITYRTSGSAQMTLVCCVEVFNVASRKSSHHLELLKIYTLWFSCFRGVRWLHDDKNKASSVVTVFRQSET
jgi:hypothetical protein